VPQVEWLFVRPFPWLQWCPARGYSLPNSVHYICWWPLRGYKQAWHWLLLGLPLCLALDPHHLSARWFIRTSYWLKVCLTRSTLHSHPCTQSPISSSLQTTGSYSRLIIVATFPGPTQLFVAYRFACGGEHGRVRQQRQRVIVVILFTLHQCEVAGNRKSNLPRGLFY